MKHVKLFEAFEGGTIFSPEDISLPGDTVFCWNFEDGWMVTLLDRSLSHKMFEYLEDNKSRLVTTDIKYSNRPGIAFVTTGIPTELAVQFKGYDFIPSSIDFFVNSKRYNEILANNSNSCAFTLKKNHVIGYRWNGGHFCVPIEDYLLNY